MQNFLLVWRSRPSVCSLSRSALSLVRVCKEVHVPFNMCKPLVYQAHNICNYTSSGSMWHHFSSRCSLKLCVEQSEPAPCTSSSGSFVANAEPPLSKWSYNIMGSSLFSGQFLVTQVCYKRTSLLVLLLSFSAANCIISFQLILAVVVNIRPCPFGAICCVLSVSGGGGATALKAGRKRWFTSINMTVQPVWGEKKPQGNSTHGVAMCDHLLTELW